MDVLTIRVSAPLQSYGNQATFNRRTTNYYPTKSAVIGLVAASLGLRREDDHIQRLNQLEYAVRIDQVGLMMTDFQTVETDPQKETRKITYREYLQDYVYAIAIGSRDKELIQAISYALLHPKFQLYWGTQVQSARRHFANTNIRRYGPHRCTDPFITVASFPLVSKTTAERYV